MSFWRQEGGNAGTGGIVTLYVGNLPEKLHWSGLRLAFGRHRDIVDSYIAKKTQYSSKKNNREKKDGREEGSASVSSSTGRSQSLKSKGGSGEKNDEENEKGKENSSSGLSSSLKFGNVKPSWAKIVKENRSPNEDNDLAAKMISEDVKKYGHWNRG
ncbi:hypothetical protein V6N11_048860 [Hibiscus sabdariffa]|uniref:RRM domain-containing protein n=1 Tax=Hibiscus sabdariffa TaxID=183260 RepID=A0ABR2PX68_9ROSI